MHPERLPRQPPPERGEEDATWESISAWANFEPVRNRPKVHEEALFFPIEFPHIFEQAWKHLDNLSKFPGFAQLSGFRRRLMSDFSVGFRKLATPPSIGPIVDGPVRFQSYVRAGAIFRLREIQDGLDYWQRIEATEPPPSPPSHRRRGLHGRAQSRLPPHRNRLQSRTKHRVDGGHSGRYPRGAQK
jgi:hypothetical protein